jgi:membrane protein
MAFAYFRVPIGFVELTRRTFREIIDDDCLGLAAQLAFYYLLALVPALLFLVALISALPVQGAVDRWLDSLTGVAPGAVLDLVREELARLSRGDSASLLTFSILGALWSSSAGMVAIISTINTAYDLDERRTWWRMRLVAIGLTLSLAIFMILAQLLLQAGPWAIDVLSNRTGMDLDPAGTIVQWGLALVLLTLAVDLIYHFAPAARREFTWLTPGAVVAVLLWVATSLAFRLYVQKLSDFATTYGALGSVIVVMLWFYLSGLAVLIGAEINSEIEHAQAAERGERVIGSAADKATRSW